MEIAWSDPPTQPIKRRFDSARCWWCGGKGDTREHRIKRTDIIREYGVGIDPDNLMIHGLRAKAQLRGPDSASYKFRSRICANCNNNRSQPFDRAEEVFATYFRAHEEEIVRSKRLSMAAIFSADLAAREENLRRYFVKHVAFVISDMGFEVTHNVLSYLNGKNPLTDVAFSPRICPSLFEIMSRLPSGTPGQLGFGDPVTHQSQETGTVYQIDGHWCYRSLHVHWSLRSMCAIPLRNPFCDDVDFGVDARPIVPPFFGGIPPKTCKNSPALAMVKFVDRGEDPHGQPLV